MNFLNDFGMFILGFLLGIGSVFLALLALRLRRDAVHAGDELVAKLGPLGTQRFLQAVRE